MGRLRCRHFITTAMATTAPSPITSPITKAFIPQLPCNSWVTCNLGVTRESSGVSWAVRAGYSGVTMAADLDTPFRGGFVEDEHHFALTVYFEDTDTAGVVYYANYLKFIERARSDMLRAAGIDQRAAQEAGEGVYAVAEANIRYLRPARLGDDLLVLSTVEQVRAASVVIHQ